MTGEGQIYNRNGAKLMTGTKQGLRSASSPAPPPSTADLRLLPFSFFLLTFSVAPEISFARTAGQTESEVEAAVVRVVVAPAADGTDHGIAVPAPAAIAAVGGY
jgi:hypothetical protein